MRKNDIKFSLEKYLVGGWQAIELFLGLVVIIQWDSDRWVNFW